MFLKQLDIIGFKSFAERISIEFDSGITAVVGPNGSGKSNITDAIRWVLGEQSARSLRGGRMEDVIFSGSDSREPLNFAEVTLTLQNHDRFLPIDYSEVSVTRRVYRTGESEFYINKQRCRLRDIVELFMDSGLGRESFSIISQGKVEQVLNSKAEERRTIFEEAAGVLKYKTRKRQAENKLQDTEENLNRVNDIIHELEGQLEPLEKQAKIANRYLEKQANLEKVEVALIAVEIEQLHKQWQQLTIELQTKKEQAGDLSTKITLHESQNSQTNNEIAKLDEEVNQLQTRLLETTEQIEKLTGQKDVLAERQKNTLENKERLEQNIKRLTNSLEKLQLKQTTLQHEESIIKQTITELTNDLTANELQLKKLSENIAGQLDNLKNEYFELLSERANCNNEIKHLEQQLEQLDRRQQQLQDKNEQQLKERSVIKKQKAGVQTKLTNIKLKIDQALQNFNKINEARKEITFQKENQANKLTSIEQKWQQAKSRQQALAEMEEDFAGFFYGVKQILRARKGKLTGIYGAVAELIDVPKKYETAIEIALGSAMQNVIVDDEQSARKAIKYLTSNSFGRATFLPLSIITERYIPKETLRTIENHSAFIGIASQLISYDNKFSKVINNLLGTVVVTTNLKGANELARLLNYRYRFVTITGDIVHPGGSMTGGKTKQNTSSILSRKTELSQLEDEIKQLASKVELERQQLQKTAEKILRFDKQLETIRQEGEELRVQEQIINGDLREIEVSEKNLNDRLTLFDIDNNQIETTRQETNEKINELTILTKQLTNEINNKDEKIKELTVQKDTEHSSREQLIEKNKEVQINLSVKKQTLTNISNNLQNITDQINDEQIELNAEQAALSNLTTRLTNNVDDGNDLVEEISALGEKRATITTAIAMKREQRFRLQQQVSDRESELKGLRIKQTQLNEAITSQEVKLNRYDIELDNKLTYLREQYSLTYEGAQQQYELTVSVEEAKDNVKKMKAAIKGLGVVNLGAIDEYERISERYEFLLAQQLDLLTAMDNLFEIIAEMDTEMKKRFEATFNDVKIHFEPVFQALFGGGRADLILSDPEDMLNTGIDIVAQPPGKRLQNLALLSGGERALTAIALLFAILKVRPVPFCVLDEVEAALDEANVHRFSEYLRQFSKETQFIVITHRKGTMEGADILYGVTMQESGVSKLVSVRLEDVEEMA